MTSRLAPYGSIENAAAAAVGDKGKTPLSLVARMPSPDIVAKVGSKNPITGNLAARMPSAEVAAKVGIDPGFDARSRRVVRRLAQA